MVQCAGGDAGLGWSVVCKGASGGTGGGHGGAADQPEYSWMGGSGGRAMERGLEAPAEVEALEGAPSG